MACAAKKDEDDGISKFIDHNIARSILAHNNYFIFDCDGVIWDANGIIDGSSEVVEALSDMNKKVFFISNNSRYSRKQLIFKLQMNGFPADEENVVCSSFAAALHLKSIGYRDMVYCVGTEDGLGSELKNVGIRNRSFTPNVSEIKDLLETELDSDIKCVVVGFDPDINYTKIAKAASYLKNPDCLFIACNDDRKYPTPADSDIIIPDAGAMVAAIKFASGREPLCVGKPTTYMFDYMKRAFGIKPSKTIIIGDTLQSDIAFADNCGIQSLLVLSGNTSEEELAALLEQPEEDGVPRAAVPRYFTGSVGELGELLSPQMA